MLPGLYDDQTYLKELNQFRLLHNYIVVQRAISLKAYHDGQILALKDSQAPPQFVNSAGLSKRMIQGGVLAVLVSAQEAQKWRSPQAKTKLQADHPKLE